MCDTVYEMEYKEKDDFKCLEVANPVCSTKTKTLFDKTCKTTYTFNCRGLEPESGYGMNVLKPLHPLNMIAKKLHKRPPGSISNCKRIPNTKCRTTPRTVKVQKCEEKKTDVCEKLTMRHPAPRQK